MSTIGRPGAGGFLPAISAEQVAILADRVDTLIGNYNKLEGLLLGMANQQSQSAQQLAVFQERLGQATDGQMRANVLAKGHSTRLDEQLKRIDEIAQKVTVHAWSWKLFGTVAVLSLSLVGWTFSELQRLNTTISEQKQEVKMLNFMISKRNEPQEQPK